MEEKKVSQGRLSGREFLVEVEGMGQLRSRHFWVGRSLYTLLVAYQPRFLNARAADYFLDSFRLAEGKATAAERATARQKASEGRRP
jgi:hypothetical protein